MYKISQFYHWDKQQKVMKIVTDNAPNLLFNLKFSIIQLVILGAFAECTLPENL